MKTSECGLRADPGEGQPMSDGSATKDSALSDSSSALPARQLVDQWRAHVDAIIVDPKSLVALEFAAIRRTYRNCADELEAALAALLDPARQEERLTYCADYIDAILESIDDGITLAQTRSSLECLRRRIQRAALLDPAPPQEDLPAEAAKILRDHAWDLYDGTPLDPAPPETNAEDLTRRDSTGEPVVSSPPQPPNGD